MDWAPIAAKVAPVAIQYLLQRITGSPRREQYQQFIQQQQPMLKLLQAQAMGKPSPASRFIESRIQQAMAKAKQAAAATATRQHLGTTSRIAQQQRLDQQQAQAIADALAQLQLGAQQQYAGLMGQVGTMQAGMAQAEMQAQAQQAQSIGAVIEDILAEYNKQKEETGQTDNALETAANWLNSVLSGIAATGYQNYVPTGIPGQPQTPLVNQMPIRPQPYSPLSTFSVR